jgi:hypothetical protein
MQSRSVGNEPKQKQRDKFFCRFLNTNISISDCISGYVNANSLNIRHSPCYKCSYGLKIRSHFANT